MLLPPTIFTGAVTLKYFFSFNQFLSWNSFPFRKLWHFSHGSWWLSQWPRSLLTAAGGHLSGWFCCHCSWCDWKLGAEGPEPSLLAQAPGGWVLLAAPCRLFRSGAALSVHLMRLLIVYEGLQDSAGEWQASASALCFPSWFHGLNGGQVFLNW